MGNALFTNNFCHHHHHDHHDHSSNTTTTKQQNAAARSRHHHASIAHTILEIERKKYEAALDKHGLDGLRAIGFDFVIVTEQLNHINNNNKNLNEKDVNVIEKTGSIEEVVRGLHALDGLQPGVTVSMKSGSIRKLHRTQSCDPLPHASSVNPTKKIIADNINADDGNNEQDVNTTTKPDASPEQKYASSLYLPLEMRPQDPNEVYRTRLIHTKTQTLITDENRKRYISDGPMYEEVSRLCTEYAQDCMMHEANLEWVQIHRYDDELLDSNHTSQPKNGYKKKKPIRALVTKLNDVASDNHSSTSKTLLICTGKGQVRCGVFSRHFMMTQGLEVGTAILPVRDALKRKMNIVIVDPNVNGDRHGAFTLITTMKAFLHPNGLYSKYFLAARSPTGVVVETADGSDNHVNNGGNNNKKELSEIGEEKKDETDNCHHANNKKRCVQEKLCYHGHDVYILSHSASGSQIVKFLHERPGGHGDIKQEEEESNEVAAASKNENNDKTGKVDCDHYYRYGKHRIRALVFTDSTHNIHWIRENRDLTAMLQSKAAVYFRSSDRRWDDDWDKRKPGDFCETDKFWKHRFGEISTLWAGTHEHSLTNFIAHEKIFEHFDSIISTTK